MLIDDLVKEEKSTEDFLIRIISDHAFSMTQSHPTEESSLI